MQWECIGPACASQKGGQVGESAFALFSGADTYLRLEGRISGRCGVMQLLLQRDI